MAELLPLFPLQIVVFPHEKLPLHIFENRYKELIKDCELNNSSFGIPAYLNGSMEFGTEMKIIKVAKIYESGAADVICEASKVFEIKEFYLQQTGKPYAGGIVEYLENINDGKFIQQEKLRSLVQQLYILLGVPPINIPSEKISSFTFPHKIGLSVQQEYNLLRMTSESERLDYLISHLEFAIPLVKEINRTQEVIEMNGHFKNFDPLDFGDFVWEKK